MGLVRTVWRTSTLIHQKKDLIILYRLAVLHHDLHDLPVCIRFDLIHELHRLDNAEYLAYFDKLAFGDVGIGIGGGGAIESADNGGPDLVKSLLRPVGWGG